MALFNIQVNTDGSCKLCQITYLKILIYVAESQESCKKKLTISKWIGRCLRRNTKEEYEERKELEIKINRLLFLIHNTVNL